MLKRWIDGGASIALVRTSDLVWPKTGFQRPLIVD